MKTKYEFSSVPCDLPVLLQATYPDENVGLTEQFDLGWPVLGGCLLQSLNEQGIFCDPGCNQKHQSRHVFSIQQRVLRTLPNEILEPSITLHQIFENHVGVIMPGCESAKSLPPPERKIMRVNEMSGGLMENDLTFDQSPR